MTLQPSTLPEGCIFVDLKTHRDPRGTFTEIFRGEWETRINPIQWNIVHSNAGVLRGVHVHINHSDYLTCVSGTLLLALQDLRPNSPTEGVSAIVPLIGNEKKAMSIPPGVAHGFYYPEPSIHCYAVSHYWNLEDELGCRWDDPELKLDWNVQKSPHLSARDEKAGTFSEMREAYIKGRHARGLNA